LIKEKGQQFQSRFTKPKTISYSNPPSSSLTAEFLIVSQDFSNFKKKSKKANRLNEQGGDEEVVLDTPPAHKPYLTQPQ